jgi:hypothetical protein
LRFGGLPQVLWCFFFLLFFFLIFLLYLSIFELLGIDHCYFFQFTFHVVSFESWARHVNLNLLWLFFFIQFCSLTLSCFKIKPHILFLQIFFYLEIIVFLIRSIYYHTLFFCLKIILLNSIRSITYCHFFIFFLFYN